jgi:hypothetical protein
MLLGLSRIMAGLHQCLFKTCISFLGAVEISSILVFPSLIIRLALCGVCVYSQDHGLVVY